MNDLQHCSLLKKIQLNLLSLTNRHFYEDII